MQVVQLEAMRSLNVVSNPIANMRDQINTAYLNLKMRTARTHDGMSMAARHAGCNDRVNAGIEDWFFAGHAPESVGGRYKQKPYGQKRDYHLVQKKVGKKNDKRRGGGGEERGDCQLRNVEAMREGFMWIGCASIFWK